MGDVMREYHGGQNGFESFGTGNGNGAGFRAGHADGHDSSPREAGGNDPFGYPVAPMENPSAMGPSASQGNILDGNDDARMANFFDHLQDPNDSQALVQSSNEHGGVEDFSGLPFADNFGDGHYTFDPTNGTINPAVTLSGLPTSNVQTHHHDASHLNFGGFPFNDFPEIFHSGVPGDVEGGAQLLANLANSAPTSGAQNTHPHSGHGGAWGLLGSAGAFTGNHQHDSRQLQNLASQAVMQIEPYANNLHAQSPVQGQHMQHSMNGHNGLPHARSHSAHEGYAASGLMFSQQGAQSASPAVRQPARIPTTISWGSDPQFSEGRNYQGEYEAMQQEKMRNLMQVPLADRAAAANGQARSPTQHMSPHEQRTSLVHNMNGFHDPFANSRNTNTNMGPPSRPGTAGFSGMTDGSTAGRQTNGNGFSCNDAQSRKRRKSQMEREDEDEYVPGGYRARATIPNPGPKVPKASMQYSPSDDDEEEEDEDDDSDLIVRIKPAPKRRKSVVNTRAADPSSPHTPIDSHSPLGVPGNPQQRRPSGRSRANLTEEQKRQNHILSEQKRRVVIKQGYEQLEKLVPSLKNGKSGLSKAEQIKEVAAYLSSVVKGNRRMKQHLAQLEQQQERFREQQRQELATDFSRPRRFGRGEYEEYEEYEDGEDEDGTGAGAGVGPAAGPWNGQGSFFGYGGGPHPPIV